MVIKKTPSKDAASPEDLVSFSQRVVAQKMKGGKVDKTLGSHLDGDAALDVLDIDISDNWGAANQVTLTLTEDDQAKSLGEGDRVRLLQEEDDPAGTPTRFIGTVVSKEVKDSTVILVCQGSMMKDVLKRGTTWGSP